MIFLFILGLGKHDSCFKMSKGGLLKDLKNDQIEYKTNDKGGYRNL